MRLGPVSLATVFALLAAPALALAQVNAGHSDMQMPNGARADQAMMEGMNRMNQAMTTAPLTGDPDHDFVAMMIPHHQGAVDMAKVELQYGQDPAMRRLAQDIIDAQNKEITQMRQWQSAHPVPAK